MYMMQCCRCEEGGAGTYGHVDRAQTQASSSQWYLDLHCATCCCSFDVCTACNVVAIHDTSARCEHPRMFLSGDHSQNIACVCVCLQACNRHRITAGVFCLGEERAAALAGRGFTYVAYDTDLGAMMSYTASVQGRLKPSGTTTACAPEATTTKMARSSVGGDVEADVPHAS
jgi:hypothetical protein